MVVLQGATGRVKHRSKLTRFHAALSEASPLPVRSRPCCSTPSCWLSRGGTAAGSSLRGCVWPCLAGTESLDRRKRLKKSQPDYRCISHWGLFFLHLSISHTYMLQRLHVIASDNCTNDNVDEKRLHLLSRCVNGSKASDERSGTN